MWRRQVCGRKGGKESKELTTETVKERGLLGTLPKVPKGRVCILEAGYVWGC